MWDSIRYRNFCLQQFERASAARYRPVLGLDLYTIAERELERDWSLRCFIETVAYGENPVTRLAEDIRRHGQVSSIASSMS